jgi:hypothetical protein
MKPSRGYFLSYEELDQNLTPEERKKFSPNLKNFDEKFAPDWLFNLISFFILIGLYYIDPTITTTCMI